LVNDPNLWINRVNLSGMVGYVQEKKLEDLFAFTLVCNAPGQQVLGHNASDGLGFRMDAWGEDAKRLTRLIHVGRGCSVEGVLRYNTWKNGNGEEAFAYQVRIRSGLYQCFGKNKNLVEREDGTPVSSGYKKEEVVNRGGEQTLPAAAPVSVEAAPCSVNPEEIPF